MLGSAKTNLPLLTLTSWVKGTSSFEDNQSTEDVSCVPICDNLSSPDTLVGGEWSWSSGQTWLPHPWTRDRKGRRPSSQVQCQLLIAPLANLRLQSFDFCKRLSPKDSTLKPQPSVQKVLDKWLNPKTMAVKSHQQEMQLFCDPKLDPFVVAAWFIGPSIPPHVSWCRKGCFFACACISQPFLGLTANH